MIYLRQLVMLVLVFSHAACTEMVIPEVPDPEVPGSEVPPVDGIFSANYYVSTKGDDGNNGTFEYPFATWAKAFDVAMAGDSILIRGGEYKPNQTVLFANNSGTPDDYIVIQNYPGEKPVLNCENISPSSSTIGIIINGVDYTTIKGLTITGVRQSQSGSTTIGCLVTNCNRVVLEQMDSHHNDGSGFYMDNNQHILLKNCDAYSNYDMHTPGYSGGNADGFGIVGANRGIYARLVGCRAWDNSDDGFDAYNNEGTVIIDSCWAYDNGYSNGDGNGFKLGQTKLAALDEVQRVVRNCITAENKSMGLNENHANVKMEIYNNTSYGNQYGFLNFATDGYREDVIYRNNIAFDNEWESTIFRSAVIQDHNNWNLSSLSTLTDDEFLSTDATQLLDSRQNDGSLPEITFLVPTADSELNESGVDVDLPYSGDAAYIGVFEGN